MHYLSCHPRTIIISFLIFFAATLHANNNLFSNADFKEGLKNWKTGMSSEMVKYGCRILTEGNKLIANIPMLEAPGTGSVLLWQQPELEPGRKYILKYTLKTSAPGTMRQVYQMFGKPWRALGLSLNVDVPAGKKSFCIVFTAAKNETDVPVRMLLNLSLLKGDVEIYDISLEKADPSDVPYALNKQWTVFTGLGETEELGRVPDTLLSPEGKTVHPVKMEAKDNLIDLATAHGKQLRVKTKAILYNEFESTEKGFMRIGFSADWWMEVYVNNRWVYSTMARGNGGGAPFSPDDHIIDIPVEAGGNILAVKVLSGSKGWALCCGTPGRTFKFKAGKDWKPVTLGNPVVLHGSALDMSAVSDAPAGKYGRLTVNNKGTLVYKNQPSKILHLHGFNSTAATVWNEKDKENFKFRASKFAKAIRLQGYNLIRMNGLDKVLCTDSENEMSINPEYLDRIDYLIAELKKQGVYTQIVILSLSLYTGDSNYSAVFNKRDKHKLMMYMGNEWERKRFAYAVDTLMNHVNPYTQTAWKDETAIALVEFYNEQYSGMVFLPRLITAESDSLALVTKKWHKWLKHKSEQEESGRLMNILKNRDLSTVKIPAMSSNDNIWSHYFSLFCTERIIETNEWYKKTIEKTGYTGLTSQSGYSNLIYSIAAWQTIPVIDNHSYYAHPSNWDLPGSRVRAQSSIERLGDYWRGLNSERLSGRPFFVGEYNHAFWNSYRYEAGMLFSAYSALQGFSAIAVHSDPVILDPPDAIMGSFTCGHSLISRASQFISTCMFARGDVSSAKKTVKLNISRKYVESKGHSWNAVSSEQNKLALISNFSLYFPWAPTPEGIEQGPEADMLLSPSGTSGIEAHEWFVNVEQNEDHLFSLDAFVSEMKKRGILPEENITRPSENIFQSDTGEIILQANKKLMKVVTARTEAISTASGSRQKLNRMELIKTTTPACVALCSVDDNNIKDSKRMVLVYSTEEANSGMELAPGRETLISLGHSPVLMKTGQLEI
ncbi:MAG: hypothetical protein JXR78_07820, partial [Victivallales bacterium]|nr:hypothetical protein [Victivallales bacterium]